MIEIQAYKLFNNRRYNAKKSQSNKVLLPKIGLTAAHDVFEKTENITFTSRCPKIPEIKDFKEYEEVIKRVCNSKTIYDEKFWTIDTDYNMYSGIKPEYVGLLPYCGYADVSYYINKFLRNQMNFEKFSESSIASNYTPTKESIIDIVRALDYSLLRLDEEFGKYSGIVFRKGIFKPKSRQFNSATTSSAIAIDFAGFSPLSGFSVIRTNNGHRICDFQAKMKSKYAKTEKEILLPRFAEYRRLNPKDYDREIFNAQNILAQKIYEEMIYTGLKKELKYYTKDKILKLIKVYEEI